MTTTPALVAVDVAGDADAWAAAGFAVGAGGFRVGQVQFRTGAADTGITAWTLARAEPSDAGEGARAEVVPSVHPNGSVRLDHLVVFTDDPERTAGEYGERGLGVRRVRDVGNGTTQTFFRAGEVIIELVGPVPGVPGERAWGLAFAVTDLDACAARLGDRLGPVQGAVQPGRRIATLRHEACGLTVPVAFLSD